MVSKLAKVDLREVWTSEPNFTSWLYENIDILNEQLGIKLNALEKEKSVGPFFVDIMGEDQEGRPVIIENQLERTNHDHLGKVFTYLSNLEGKTAIWITSEPRPEHVTAISYLNEIVPEDTSFYLLQLQAFKIGDSDPAPLFTVIAGPSSEASERGKIKKEFAGREKQRYEFFEQLLEKSNKKTSLFANVSPTGYQHWINAGAGKFGLGLSYVVKLNQSRVELFIAGLEAEQNKARFDTLKEKGNEIEAAFGEPLEWDYKEGRKQHYLRSYSKVGGLQDEDKWSEIQDDLVDRMVRMEKAVKAHVKALA
jgi:hypothetical protein